MKFTTTIAAMVLAFTGTVSAWPRTLSQGCYAGKCVQDCLAETGMDGETCFSDVCDCNMYAQQDMMCDENLGFALAGPHGHLGCGDDAWAKAWRIHEQRKMDRAKKTGENLGNPADVAGRVGIFDPTTAMRDGVVIKISPRDPSSSSSEEDVDNISVPQFTDEKCLRECVATCQSNTGMDAETCAGNCDCFDKEAWKDAHPFEFHQFMEIGEPIAAANPVILTDEQKAELGIFEKAKEETATTHLPAEATSIIEDVQGKVTPVVSKTTSGTTELSQDHATILPIETVTEAIANIPGMPGIVTEGIPAVPTPSMTKRSARSVKALETEAPVAERKLS